MSTFLEMQQRIGDDLNRTDLTTQIKKAINRAIKFYLKEPFWFKETSGSFSTIVAQKTYTSTDTSITDIGRIHLMEASINSALYEIKERPLSFIMNRNPNSAQGVIRFYAWWADTIYFYLVPSTIWTVTIYYTKKYTELSADADTNDWLVYAEDLIEARARKWLYARVIKNTEQAQIAELEEAQSLQALREINEGYVAQGRIPPTSF